MEWVVKFIYPYLQYHDSLFIFFTDEIGASDADDYDKSFSNDIKKDYNINKKDEQAFERFMNTSTGPRRTLAEILQEKITEKRTEVDTMYSDVDSLQQRDLDPRVVEMYQSVGKILSKYRSGKVPKAFKVIAQFKNWEDLLMLTEPGNILISREKN